MGSICSWCCPPPEELQEDYAEIVDPRVIVHVYDVGGSKRITRANRMFKALGTGMYHAAVEIYGPEWSFDGTDEGTGVYGIPPKTHECHRYRESVEMGDTKLSKKQVAEVIRKLKLEWQGEKYDVLRFNCCHFCDALCKELDVGPLPRWILNMAGAGAKVADVSHKAAKPVAFAASLAGAGARKATKGAAAVAAAGAAAASKVLPSRSKGEKAGMPEARPGEETPKT